MIIRMTVNDNDFSEIIEPFIKNFIINVCFYKKDENQSYEKRVKEYELSEKALKYLNPNLYEDMQSYTQEELDELNSIIKKAFKVYVLEHCQTNANYLIEKLEVTFQDSFTDKWENSEAYYYFLHSQKYINQ